jgi:hypothetical protein
MEMGDGLWLSETREGPTIKPEGIENISVKGVG